jgi:predicted enzyme related to lactoylglutathione lyase
MARQQSTATKPAKPSPQVRAAKRDLDGWITHTELASADPQATRRWCAKVLGWEFRESLDLPDGEYQLFHYSDLGGGGIRATRGAEPPGSTPTVHVPDCRKAFDKAVREGAEVVEGPRQVMPGTVIALVRAPGGVLIGLSGES